MPQGHSAVTASTQRTSEGSNNNGKASMGEQLAKPLGFTFSLKLSKPPWAFISRSRY